VDDEWIRIVDIRKIEEIERTRKVFQAGSKIEYW